jgi:hypothetical protein
LERVGLPGGILKQGGERSTNRSLVLLPVQPLRLPEQVE